MIELVDKLPDHEQMKKPPIQMWYAFALNRFIHWFVYRVHVLMCVCVYVCVYVCVCCSTCLCLLASVRVILQPL